MFSSDFSSVSNALASPEIKGKFSAIINYVRAELLIFLFFNQLKKIRSYLLLNQTNYPIAHSMTGSILVVFGYLSRFCVKYCFQLLPQMQWHPDAAEVSWDSPMTSQLAPIPQYYSGTFSKLLT